ncbi:hypothetical protein ES702_03200 [subsurface metagenome]
MYLVTLDQAAGLLGVSRRSVHRFERRGFLDFQRVGGRVYVDVDELMSAPLLTRGRAARLVGRSWWTARRWTHEGGLTVHYPAYANSRGRCSLDEIYFAKSQKRRWRSAE